MEKRYYLVDINKVPADFTESLTHPNPTKKYGLKDFNKWKKENVQKFLKFFF